MMCKICHSEDLRQIYSNKQQYIFTQGICKYPNDPRLSKTHELTYYFCNNCGYIFNPAPITSQSDDTYKDLYVLNPQNLSEKDREAVIKIYDLILQNTRLEKQKTILEIGVNDGFFLDMFEKDGYLCTGIDPSPAVKICSNNYPNIKLINNYFDPIYFKSKFDLIICRNVIEHLKDPIKFILSIKGCLKSDGFVYFEVPNVQKILEHKLYTNLYHEHISYFYKDLFEEINANLGFKTIYIGYNSYDDVIAYIGQNKEQKQEYKFESILNLDNLKGIIEGFKFHLKSFKKEIIQIIKDFTRKKLKIGLWGAGSTAINVLSFSGHLNYSDFYLFDSSKTKIGKYLPGFGKEIFSPREIKNIKPDVIIIMSERYIEEIFQSLEEMQFTNDIWVLYPEIKQVS